MPILQTGRRVVPPYVAAWVPLAALLTAVLRLGAETSWTSACVVSIPASALLALVFSAVRFPVRGLPADRMPATRLLAVHVTGAVVTTALWLGALRVWVEALASFRPFRGLVEIFERQSPFLAAVALLLYLLAVTFHSLLHAVERGREAERRTLELQVVARDAELTALRAQVDPHFLFNALNAVAGLTHSDPVLARRLCVRLGEFLRATLRIGRKERIPLAEELVLARDFLAVETVRFGERLEVVEHIDEASLPCEVPPLILQPLLENAVRHGIAGLVAGGEVALTTRVTGSVLAIEIENPRDPEAPTSGGEGVGLANVRGRLRALYGDASALQIIRGRDRFRVEISIPFRAAPRVSESDDHDHG